MRIAYIAAGAAGMYCGSCLNDNALASALQGMGHEALLIPTYTPLRTDESDVSIDRVFYGAVSVYLEQKVAWFRHMPPFLDRLLSHPWLLNLASRLGTSVDAADLGELTLSVLRGEHGRQRLELEQLAGWLSGSFRPDVVHLSNSLLLGMARGIRDATGAKVFCSLQGEDLFLDGLPDGYRSSVLAEMRARVPDADGFLAPCGYYKDHMGALLEIPPERIRVVRLGLNLEGLSPAAPQDAARPFTVGYLARISRDKGLHLLVDAFRRLAEAPGGSPVRLRVAGYLGASDRKYFRDVQNRVQSSGLESSVDFVGEVDRAGKVDFLRSLDVLSVPTLYRDPKGRFVLEALACGVPVVQPDHGGFGEMVSRTGGGLVVEPGSVEALARGLGALRDDPAGRREMGRRGRAEVERSYSARAMAEATLSVYGSMGATAGSAGAR